MVPRALFRVSLFSVTTIVLLSVLSLRSIVNAYNEESEEFCPDDAIVDLTNATHNATGFFAQSDHFFPTEIVRYKDGQLRGCMCDIRFCVLLCTPLRNASGTRISGSEQSDDSLPEIPPIHSLEDHEDPSIEPFNVFFGTPCLDKRAYYLEPDKYESEEWNLLKNGSLFLPRENESDAFLGWRQYCFRQRRNQTTYTPQVCSPTMKPDPFRTASYIGGLVSVPFLIATIFVYSVLPKLRNISGNIFRCYLCCLLATYVTLAADRIPPPESNIGTTCLVLAFLIYFSFITTFLWLNVMCFDMCWRFGGFGSHRSSGKQYDRKKFIGYSIYAWGIGIAMTAICIGTEFLPGLSESVITPGFQELSCWFSTKLAAALYFFGPMGITIICNIYFFILTSVKLFQHKRNAQQQGDNERQDDNKISFGLYLKLFIIMGISWSTEIITGLWAAPKYVSYFTDMVNGLQGVLIFIIFVCKKKIWRSLQKRFKCFPRFKKNGCTFTEHSTDSKATNSSFDDSISHSNNSIALDVRTDTSPAN